MLVEGEMVLFRLPFLAISYHSNRLPFLAISYHSN